MFLDIAALINNSNGALDTFVRILSLSLSSLSLYHAIILSNKLLYRKRERESEKEKKIKAKKTPPLMYIYVSPKAAAAAYTAASA